MTRSWKGEDWKTEIKRTEKSGNCHWTNENSKYIKSGSKCFSSLRRIDWLNQVNEMQSTGEANKILENNPGV